MFDLLYPHPRSLLLLIPFFFIALPAAAESNDTNHLNCPSYKCGSVTISYPFWKMDTGRVPQFCGYEGFGINCTTNKCNQSLPEIIFGGNSYYVEGINYDSKNIIVTDSNVFSPIPGTDNCLWRAPIYVYGPDLTVLENIINCPRVRHGINLQTLPLIFSMRNTNLSFHFNCTGCPSWLTEIPCWPERNEGKSCVHIINTNTTDETNWDEYSCTDEVVTTVTDYIYGFHNLSRFGQLLQRGFELEWGSTDDCHKCEESNGRCGYQNTRGFTCFCTDGTIKKVDCKGAHSFNRTIKLVIGVGSTLLSFVVIFIICCILKPVSSNWVASLKHKTEEDKNIEAFVMEYGSLSTKRYRYSDIKKMTNSFNVKLGQGGFGQVFKGMISDGRLVAVKVLSATKSNGQEFINEVASMGRTSHVNIVTLLGFCFDCKKRALVYEYMPNGSLEKYIHSQVPMETSEHIGLKKLYEIALGIAHGLDYLHRGCNTRILHLDIKPHNILLDEDFCPKIADFGLAKLYSRKESVVSMLDARGTLGYIAPEVYNRNFGRVSHKSDVYSYGMLLLEMVGGRKNLDIGVGPGRTSEIYFPDWIYQRLQKHDFLLDSIRTTEENDYARKMATVGLQCIQHDPSQRPSINEVIEMLEGSMETLEFPPKSMFSSPPSSPAII